MTGDSLVKKLLLIILMSTSFAAIPISSHITEAITTADVSISAEVTPRKAIKQWRYKFINEVLHKRLYNHSTNKYEGSWTKV